MEMRTRFAENAQKQTGKTGHEDEEQPYAWITHLKIKFYTLRVLLLFRSYKPVDAKANPSTASMIEEINSLERNVADQLEASKDMKTANVLDLKTLAPKKIDWDLQRGIRDKLNKLDKRTNKAITQLISLWHFNFLNHSN